MDVGFLRAVQWLSNWTWINWRYIMGKQPLNEIGSCHLYRGVQDQASWPEWWDAINHILVGYVSVGFGKNPSDQSCAYMWPGSCVKALLKTHHLRKGSVLKNNFSNHLMQPQSAVWISTQFEQIHKQNGKMQNWLHWNKVYFSEEIVSIWAPDYQSRLSLDSRVGPPTRFPHNLFPRLKAH